MSELDRKKDSDLSGKKHDHDSSLTSNGNDLRNRNQSASKD